ncbi:hypothetical protein ACIQW9_04455 [Herminiimonas sp. NPDC097707]|uniref:hypothetical protein n=1 Tax=Herminiimonas sp. NPDC097707 TaxID=3364007 RepID=UPI00383B81B2
MVDDLITIHRHNYAASGAELIMGDGKFVAPKMIKVQLQDGETRQLRGQNSKEIR